MQALDKELEKLKRQKKKEGEAYEKRKKEEQEKGNRDL